MRLTSPLTGNRWVDIEHNEDLCRAMDAISMSRSVDEEADVNTKPTNPKDKIGVKKAPLHVIPSEVLFELGLALLEGSRRYGSHNYRVAGALASVYYDAAERHLMAWWEGEDIDPDSGLPHLAKALACITILLDAAHTNKLEDDRPPKLEKGWIQTMNELAGEVIDRYPKGKEPYTEKSHG